jgi:hypothetical protein
MKLKEIIYPKLVDPYSSWVRIPLDDLSKEDIEFINTLGPRTVHSSVMVYIHFIGDLPRFEEYKKSKGIKIVYTNINISYGKVWNLDALYSKLPIQ